MTDKELFNWVGNMLASFKEKSPDGMMIVIWSNEEKERINLVTTSIEFNETVHLLRHLSIEISSTVRS